MANGTGIVKRHARSCKTRQGAACSCKPTFQAWVWSARDQRKIRQTFTTHAAAKAWRSDADRAVRKGTLSAAPSVTLDEAAQAWLGAVKSGAERTRSERPYKPSTVRGYEQALRDRVLPELGSVRLANIRRIDIQDLIDRMLADGLDASTVRNAVMPLRAIYRRAVYRGDVGANPTSGLKVPAVNGKRDRVATPGEAATLLDALPDELQPLYATAFYAGLRRGELRALRWEDVDLASGIIRVERSWDDEAGEIDPKSAAGRRTTPIIGRLRDLLTEHKARSGNGPLVFGTQDGAHPFTPSNVRKRAVKVWTDAKLEPIGLQEARHTCASILIDAGLNAKKVQTYMGHSSITITYDVYGHLLDEHEKGAAEKVDEYLERADTAARLAQVEA